MSDVLTGSFREIDFMLVLLNGNAMDVLFVHVYPYDCDAGIISWSLPSLSGSDKHSCTIKLCTIHGENVI